MKYTRQDKTRAIIILENTQLLLGAMNDLDNYTGLDRLSRFINLGTGVKHDYEAVTWALKAIVLYLIIRIHVDMRYMSMI